MANQERTIAWNFAIASIQLHANTLEAEGYSKQYVSDWVDQQVKEFESQYV